jgi:hypothetical protein
MAVAMTRFSAARLFMLPAPRDGHSRVPVLDLARKATLDAIAASARHGKPPSPFGCGFRSKTKPASPDAPPAQKNRRFC